MQNRYQNESNTKYEDARYLHDVIEPSLLNYNKNIIKLILNVEGQKRSIMDFGAGSGALAKIIKLELKKSPVCIEVDGTLRSVLKENGFEVHKNILGTEKYFDLIYSSNVLEHIKDDDQTLLELKNKLKKDGSLVLYLPAFKILFSDLDLKVGHYRRYEKKQLISQLKRLGFKINQIHYADSIGFIGTLLICMFGWNTRTGLGSKISLIAYDRFFFPISKFLDNIGFKYLIGKNIFVSMKRG
tara:strand:+ start:2439 stop:3164 length:726 start_codon:yes stop_codon:yes gene_type:complete